MISELVEKSVYYLALVRRLHHRIFWKYFYFILVSNNLSLTPTNDFFFLLWFFYWWLLFFFFARLMITFCPWHTFSIKFYFWFFYWQIAFLTRLTAYFCLWVPFFKRSLTDRNNAHKIQTHLISRSIFLTFIIHFGLILYFYKGNIFLSPTFFL